MSQVYKVSSGVNSHYGQVMVVAWRKFGNVLRKQSLRASIVLSHTKNPDPEYYNKDVKGLGLR
jgi:hypothetical protein